MKTAVPAALCKTLDRQGERRAIRGVWGPEEVCLVPPVPSEGGRLRAQAARVPISQVQKRPPCSGRFRMQDHCSWRRVVGRSPDDLKLSGAPAEDMSAGRGSRSPYCSWEGLRSGVASLGVGELWGEIWSSCPRNSGSGRETLPSWRIPGPRGTAPLCLVSAPFCRWEH